MEQQGSERADLERKLAEAIRSSQANTREFVQEMRAQDIGHIALFARRSARPPEPEQKFWQKKSAIKPVRLVEHSYSFLAHGWAVWPPSAEGYNDYLFVVDNDEDPTVYKNTHTPSPGSSFDHPDTPPVKKDEPCLILGVPDHLKPDAYVIKDAFSGDYGADLLLDAMRRRGLPGYQ
jgi:hypothetical protein